MAARGPLVCVIAGGDLPDGPLVKRIARSAEMVVCADGGARHARRLGIRPDLILGDLDSLPPAVRRFFRGVTVRRVPDQESTDLEKALKHCISIGAVAAVVLGAIGDRIDHSAGALGCFRRFGKKLRLTVVDRTGTISLLGRDETLPSYRGERFSLIPLDRCTGVRLDGARYPLRGEPLRLGVREGIGNSATGRSVRVRHTGGTLLFYRMRRARSAGRGRAAG